MHAEADRHGKRELEKFLTPARPILSRELLYGRDTELDDIIDCLEVSGGTPFVYGNRGVGKTSLARTAAQEAAGSDREPIYVACSPGTTAVALLRGVAMALSDLALKHNKKLLKDGSFEASVGISPLGISPSVKFASKVARSEAPTFGDATEAVRVIKGFDSIIPEARRTVVVLDELEEMEPSSRKDLAFFVKQIGDQLIETRFILVGIADNVHQLIGAHQSVPRYLRHVELGPLRPQELIDIVQGAAEHVEVEIPKDVLFRISIIGNGYPYFAHLMGLALLMEALGHGASCVDDTIYRKALARAVRHSNEELKASYETGAQRGTDDYRNVIWTMADMDLVDLRSDEIAVHYSELAKKQKWTDLGEPSIRKILSRLKGTSHGEIIMAPGKKYGVTKPSERRYRYHRFRENLMRGYVRLRAEDEGCQLGRRPNL